MKKYSLYTLLCLTLVLALNAEARVPTTAPGPEAARLSGSPGKAVSDLFEVRFIEINGERIQPREFIWLKPGSYTVTVTILADTTQPQLRGAAASQDRGPDGYNKIDLELEAGKTYQIRGRFNREDPEAPYSVILHRVDNH